MASRAPRNNRSMPPPPKRPAWLIWRARAQDGTGSGKAVKGGAAGNGSSSTGRAEGILVAEILLLLVVGRVLGEGMQRIGQPALMGTLAGGYHSGAVAVRLDMARGAEIPFPARFLHRKA